MTGIENMMDIMIQQRFPFEHWVMMVSTWYKVSRLLVDDNVCFLIIQSIFDISYTLTRSFLYPITSFRLSQAGH